MRTLFVIAALLVGSFASANDGGQAAIKVSEIKMREYDNKGNELRRITDPNFRIMIKGEEAWKLQKILPSQVSVVTHMNPAISDLFGETFKGLGVYSMKSKAATGKVLNITCSNGELVTDANGKPDIKPAAETTCEISVNGGIDDPSDYFGDKQDYNPRCTP